MILSDADNFPPPFRIDNYSQVALSFRQTGVEEEIKSGIAKARSSIPYAWDEPTMRSHLTVVAPGGTEATYNMNVIGEGSQLTYENFIYIAMAGTFLQDGNGGDNLESQQLVLDVEGARVFLAPKQAARRSQLWRMTPTGMLQHEGSSPPQERRKTPTDLKNCLVLDIKGPAVQPSTYVPLMLRKPDERRKLTQTWRFTEDGKLMSAHNGLFVQAKDGFATMGRG